MSRQSERGEHNVLAFRQGAIKGHEDVTIHQGSFQVDGTGRVWFACTSCGVFGDAEALGARVKVADKDRTPPEGEPLEIHA